MTVARDDLVAGFFRRASERVAQATDLWLAIESEGRARLPELRRLLHTIKGEAQMLGIADCASVLERTERLVDALARAPELDATSVGDAVLGGLEAVALRAEADDPEAFDLAAAVAALDTALASVPQTGTQEPAPRVATYEPLALAAQAVAPLDADVVAGLAYDLRRLHGEQALLLGALAEIQRRFRALLVEVRPDVSADVLRERIVKTLGYGNEIERRVVDLRSSWSANAFSADVALDKLTDAVQRASYVSTAALRTQVVRVARSAAQTLGKDVAVEVVGDAMIDAAIERVLHPCLLHIVRNAVDHGIESPEARVARGKPARGQIVVTLAQSESSVRATIEDDGGGLDHDALRAALRSRGVDTHAMSEGEVAASVFEHGMTTRVEATSISGRGVGLDVVARELGALGGHVRVESVAGTGTRFILTLPSTLRADVVVPVRSGSRGCAFPTRSVERVERLTELRKDDEGFFMLVASALPVEEGVEALTERLPVFALARVWGDAAEPAVGSVAVVIHGTTGLFAVTVDSFENPRPITFKRTEELAFRSPLVRGVSLLAAGPVMLLLDATAVHEALLAGAVLPQESMPRSHHVLVVEDAPMARELLVSILSSFGVRVTEAADGREALARALADPPDLLLTDLELPYLDGLGVLARLREDPRFVGLPAVLLTTRRDADTLSRAKALRVDRLLSKEGAVERDLRAVVDELL